MPNPDLEAIEARLLAASQFPWEADGHTIYGGNGGAVAFVAEHTNLHTVHSTGEFFSSADAAFIENAPQDISDLLTEVHRLSSDVSPLLREVLVMHDQLRNTRLALKGRKDGFEDAAAAFLLNNDDWWPDPFVPFSAESKRERLLSAISFLLAELERTEPEEA